MQKVNKYKSLHSSIESENVQLKSKVKVLTKKIGEFNSLRLNTETVQPSISTFFDESDYDSALALATQSVSVSQSKPVSVSEDSENDLQLLLKENRSLTLKMDELNEINNKIQNDLAQVIISNNAYIKENDLLRMQKDDLSSEVKVLGSSNLELTRLNSELSLELKITSGTILTPVKSNEEDLEGLKKENEALREWACKSAEDKRAIGEECERLKSQLKTLTSPKKYVVGSIYVNPQTERKHKIIYFKEDLDFIVGAGGREDFNIELEGEGVKVFKWSFKILNSETIKFTITSSEKKIFERKIDGTSEGEIDVIGEEVVLRWENDGWIRPRRVRVEWFVGEDVDVGV